MTDVYHRQLQLCLHGIGTPPDCRNKEEWPYWLSIDAFESLLAFTSARNRSHRIKLELTFDDANSSDIHVVLPRLLASGIKASFFVPTDHLGLDGYLDEAALRQLSKAGMMIGSHGGRHCDWTTLDASTLETELIRSKRTLEAITACPVNRVAPPYGRWTMNHARLAQNTGYKAFHTCGGRTSGASDYLRHRLVVRNDVDLESNIKKYTGPLMDIWSALGALYQERGFKSQSPETT